MDKLLYGVGLNDYDSKITINGKRKYVGRFNTINEAYECREIEKKDIIKDRMM